MSHVSERAISGILRIGDQPVSVLRNEALEFFSCPKNPALSEVLSSLLVLLPEFREVFAAARIPDWDDTKALAFQMAQIIVGGRDAKRPFLTEILSGSLDADKLDYMPRDCYMAGLPMPVDVDRILEKILVVDVSASELPPEYRKQFGLGDEEFVRVLALQSTGTRAFEELIVSRALLFQKLYHHQKVRAMEGMVTNAIELLAREPGDFQKLSTYLRLADDEFLLGNWPHQDTAGYKAARVLANGVVTRQAFVRALAFGPTLVEEEDKWRDLAGLVEDKGRTELRSLVTQRAKEYLTKEGQPGLADDFGESSLLIDLPDVQRIANARFFVFDEQLGPRKYGQGHEARRWTEAYEYQNTLGYVYCPNAVALAVHLAFRDIVWDQLRVSFRPESWSLPKLPARELKDLSKQLVERGAETLLFEMPSIAENAVRLRNADPSKRSLLEKYDGEIERMEHRFRTFKSSTNRVASRVEIAEWLLQFSHDDIPLAVRALNGISFWDRASLADALLYGCQVLIQERPETVQVFGLGGATTSAQHLTYLWDDIRSKVPSGITALSSIEQLSPGAPLLLFDDNVGSGGQSGTMLMQWFGVEKERWFVDEKHAEPLSPAVLETIRACDVSICYVTGKRRGLERILETAEELLGRRPRGLVVAPTDLSCFSAAARTFATAEDAARASTLFTQVGERALRDRLGEKSEEWVAQRALGYGNAGGLTVFYYNTPTTTLTALWKDSELAGSQWKALFPRRSRLH